MEDWLHFAFPKYEICFEKIWQPSIESRFTYLDEIQKYC